MSFIKLMLHLLAKGWTGNVPSSQSPKLAVLHIIPLPHPVSVETSPPHPPQEQSSSSRQKTWCREISWSLETVYFWALKKLPCFWCKGGGNNSSLSDRIMWNYSIYVCKKVRYSVQSGGEETDKSQGCSSAEDSENCLGSGMNWSSRRDISMGCNSSGESQYFID